MKLNEIKKKLQSKRFKKDMYYYANSVADNILSTALAKLEKNFTNLPLRVALQTIYNKFDQWCDQQIGLLCAPPVVITQNFTQVAKFIDKVTSQETPYSNLTVLLHGLPGTGKSFFVAMAEAVTADYSTEDLRPSVMYIAESQKEAKRTKNSGQCFRGDQAPIRASTRGSLSIYYLNEVDRYVEDPLLQAGLLEALDVPKRDMSRKSVTFLTTNHIQRIPEVMLRPGRVDLVIEVQGMTEDECKAFMKFYGFEGVMPPKNGYGLYSPAEVYAHMRAHAKLFE